MATIVVALGGNAILRAGQRGTHEEQLANVDMTAEKLAQLVKRGIAWSLPTGTAPRWETCLSKMKQAGIWCLPFPWMRAGPRRRGSWAT